MKEFDRYINELIKKELLILNKQNPILFCEILTKYGDIFTYFKSLDKSAKVKFISEQPIGQIIAYHIISRKENIEKISQAHNKISELFQRKHKILINIIENYASIKKNFNKIITKIEIELLNKKHNKPLIFILNHFQLIKDTKQNRYILKNYLHTFSYKNKNNVENVINFNDIQEFKNEIVNLINFNIQNIENYIYPAIIVIGEINDDYKNEDILQPIQLIKATMLEEIPLKNLKVA